MHAHVTGPRVLLRSLREAMAGPLEPQERLNRIVQQVAAAMKAQVCSVYVLRADNVLELFATQGLKAEAVHTSQLRVGEGLVGSIAASGRPISAADAANHPAFAYLPETGEERFKSFLGVPMKRGGQPLGVLTVQTTHSVQFDEEDVEAVETAAMVLSDLVASGELTGLARKGKELDLSAPLTLRGDRLASGIGMGHALLHEPRVVVERLFATDEAAELDRLRTAMEALRHSVDVMIKSNFEGVQDAGESEHLDVLESYRMFAHDRGWLRRLEEAVSDGLSAEGAVERIRQENRTALNRSSDPYLRERMHDFDDLARRLMKELTGSSPLGDGLTRDFIVVADTMGAAELLDYNGPHLKGLAISEATATSHVVIVARALGIAVVGRAQEVVARAETGDFLIVDGETGDLHLRPAEDVRLSYAERLEFRARRAAHYDAIRETPAVSQDGTHINLYLNAGLSVDLPQLETSGASGVGLFRTELQFMIASSLPRLGEQERFYRSVLDAAGDKPVTFRTLDIGGDKILPYFRADKEDNPALGLRAIRLSIDRPGLLRMQLRAMLRAAEGRDLKIKLPMITMVGEVDQVRVLLDREIAMQEQFGNTLPNSIQLGAMIEVPSLLWQLDELMGKVDFVSVGSNDLFQFVAASDRTNAHLANRFNPLSRPFLRALRDIARVAGRTGTPFQLCGELAGDPLSALALLGLGYRTISMPAASIGPVKDMVLSIDLPSVTQMVNAMVDDRVGSQTVTEVLTDYADHHGIPLFAV
ncbi:MAG: phosphoenolpyruvate--protein phosphotransferase [Pseudomonadota bacterium]